MLGLDTVMLVNTHHGSQKNRRKTWKEVILKTSDQTQNSPSQVTWWQEQQGGGAGTGTTRTPEQTRKPSHKGIKLMSSL